MNMQNNSHPINLSENFKKLSDPLKSLHSLSIGENVLDKKILWLFTNCLSADLKQNNLFESFIDQKTSFSEFYIRLTRNFVSQLEILGLWDLAVIAIIHIPENFVSILSKNKWIQSIIHRNFETV